MLVGFAGIDYSNVYRKFDFGYSSVLRVELGLPGYWLRSVLDRVGGLDVVGMGLFCGCFGFRFCGFRRLVG